MKLDIRLSDKIDSSTRMLVLGVCLREASSRLSPQRHRERVNGWLYAQQHHNIIYMIVDCALQHHSKLHEYSPIELDIDISISIGQTAHLQTSNRLYSRHYSNSKVVISSFSGKRTYILPPLRPMETVTVDSDCPGFLSWSS